MYKHLSGTTGKISEVFQLKSGLSESGKSEDLGVDPGRDRTMRGTEDTTSFVGWHLDSAELQRKAIPETVAQSHYLVRG